ncbi:sugar phosphate isomerase/epimerase family protein [Sinorhizobium mexicanum]|uniref:TIM barrel protein n=1 Tax=Sinorhizobium mexicanum TaxID=375549 RepID=A0A859R5D2_9HYPH|nr:sugar phosphate isomerase/epimerase [Sinorhizobium mexicanum]MBP1884048.1 inosose dehydratase [Sinorhizobium mexicanum]QLL64768.1 TIM barrel protein [Sinorhizobium mexicanum]
MLLSNAPCSWGIFYPDHPRVSAGRYLDEVAAAGYRGTELGPYGFLPTDPAALQDALAGRGLELVGTVHVHTFSDPLSGSQLLADAEKIGKLLHALGARTLTLMDEGNVYPPHAVGRLTDAEWRAMTAMLQGAQALLREKFDITLAFHPHVATAVEFEEQIDRLLQDTGIELCFDTGHHAFWNQDPLAYMGKVWDRIGSMHLKNIDATVRERMLAGDLTVREAFEAGAMCPLPDGVVDIAAVVRMLKERHFAGPVVVEQDYFEVMSESPAQLAKRNAEFLKPLI